MKLIRKIFLTPPRMPASLPFEKKCLRPDDVFRGCTYSTWTQKWSRWFMSGFPAYNPPDDMLFLRGSIEANYGSGDLIENIYEYNYQKRTGINPSLDKDIQRCLLKKAYLQSCRFKGWVKIRGNNSSKNSDILSYPNVFVLAVE